MASRHISLLYFILLTCASFAQKFVTLDCEHSVTGIFNEDTILPCKIKSTEESNPSFIQLIKDGDETAFFTFEESGKGVQSRIKLLHPNSQDVSLEIQKTQLSDKGTYQYHIETHSGYDYQYITLKVKAPYSLPNVTSFQTATRSMRTTELICETTGYPLAQIHWYVYEKRNLTSKSKTTIEETPEGLFRIISTLQIKVVESALEGNYTCAVWNVEEHIYEVQKQFPTPYSLPNVTSFQTATRSMRTTELICETTGYPLAQIHWYVYEKRNLTSKSKTTIEETPEGLFRIISTLQIKVVESALEGNYTCAVWNVEEQTYKVQKQFPIPILDQSNTDRQSDRKKSKVLTAVFVIVGALVFGIVILMVCRFRRNLYSAGRRESEFPMISNDQQSDA